MSFALITGGSKGIGKEMALILARKKTPIILVARSIQELELAQQEVLAAGSPEVKIKAIDLSKPESPKELFTWFKQQNIDIQILINNAGYGMWGFFEDLSMEAQLDMLQLNMVTLTELTYLFLPELKKQKQAYILNVASTAAYQSVPAMSTYSASKAYVLTFTRALRYELKNSNVSVTTFSPGATATNFTNRAGMQAMQAIADKFNMPVGIVAQAGIKAMFNKKAEVIPGLVNILSVFGNRFLPKFLIEQIAANLYIKPLGKK
ncbi:MAG: SDR family oxidoreductase [Bacteroidota bacterium]|nr:SDR family oxidoreductase [Bacteroidota bacterium]